MKEAGMTVESARSRARPAAVSRRSVLKLGGAALAGVATGPFVWTPARAQGFNWKRFQGKELFFLFYRKDLYDQKGWKPPKTLAELESQAKALHGPPATYGIVYRGLKNANATPWAYLLFVMGGDYFKDGKPALTSPEWVKTMDLYA